jgi:cytochrome oxidase Cu insertion factor (SCO1/SenC/PrrC family)
VNSKVKLLSLLVLFALPVLAAYLTYYVFTPVDRKNYGELLAPLPLQGGAGLLADGAVRQFAEYRGKWLMVYVGPGACPDECPRLLYDTRQVRTAQGREMERVRRVWIVTDGVPADPAVMKNQPGLDVWRPEAAFIAQFPGAQSPWKHIYLVDPLGNLMMRYPAQPNPAGMIQDIKLLLKASQIG